MKKRVFVDTNYFLRFLVRENEQQFQEVYKLLDEGLKGNIELFTDEIVIFEIYWVLKSFYKIKKEECVKLVNRLLELGFVELDKRQVLLEAVEVFSKENIELEDAYHLVCCREKKCIELATFDKGLKKVWEKAKVK
jgi:uncharacterized protein